MCTKITMKLFLLSIFIGFAMSLIAQEKQFTINSKTCFLNKSGDTLTFNDFVLLTSPKFKSKLLPSFLNNGNLAHITIVYTDKAQSFIEDDKKVVSAQDNAGNYSTANIVTEKYNSIFFTNSLNTDSYSTVQELEGQIAPNFSITDQNNEFVHLENLAKYQNDNNLPVGNLNIATMQKLGVQ